MLLQTIISSEEKGLYILELHTRQIYGKNIETVKIHEETVH